MSSSRYPAHFGDHAAELEGRASGEGGHYPKHAPRRTRTSDAGRRTRARQGQRRRPRIGLWAILTIVFLVPVTVVAAVSYGVVSAVTSRPLPSPSAVMANHMPSDTLLYDRTGTVLLADVHTPGYYHYEQTLTQMGRWLPAATVAVEDSSFWNEPGVSPSSIFRAAVVDLKARRIVEGGSTITEQLVKGQVVGDSRSFIRKVREADLAIQVGDSYSKSQILQTYLNILNYGNFAYGPKAAAEMYFHVDTSQLDLAQAAMLAGLPQDPSLLDPFVHWKAAKARQDTVLAAMVRNHLVTQAQADKAAEEDLSPPAHMFAAQDLDLAPAFTGYVMSELTAQFGAKVMKQGGLRVTTSLDWNLQQLAQTAVTSGVRANARYNVTDGALVAMDPKTGQVLSMVGSAGPTVPGADYNFAVWPPRDPGSSFKIFTYSAAIASRLYTVNTPILDAPIKVQSPGSTSVYSPTNYDRRYHGTCALQVCLGNSFNVPAVEVETATGVANVAKVAQQVGAPPFYPSTGTFKSDVSASVFQPSLTLGGYGETPLQMATGAATLADAGVTHKPQVIVGLSGPPGLTAPTPDKGHTALDPGVAYIMAQILSNNANRSATFGTSNSLVVPGYQVAAKTGTTDNFTDGWTVGFTPGLAVAVWVGNANSSPITWGQDAIFVAAPTWHRFFLEALQQLKLGNAWYGMPSDVFKQAVRGGTDYFLDGTTPYQKAPPLPTWVSVNGKRGTGPSPDGTSAAPHAVGSVPSGPGCRSWTYNGGQYWSCGSSGSGLPGDPKGS